MGLGNSHKSSDNLYKHEELSLLTVKLFMYGHITTRRQQNIESALFISLSNVITSHTSEIKLILELRVPQTLNISIVLKCSLARIAI